MKSIVGKIVNNYKIKHQVGNHCFGINYNRKCPEPYVVWLIDSDGDVCCGKYFNGYNSAISYFREVIKWLCLTIVAIYIAMTIRLRIMLWQLMVRNI